MHLLNVFRELPISLVLTFLALTSSALPVHSTQLTPANFRETVSVGLWFIEHFSPHCVHCQSFAPTWEKLIGETERNAPAVRLAQVNCALYGDFCSESGIKGYPTLTMYFNGAPIEKYKGNRHLDDLEIFIKRHVDSMAPEPQAIRSFNTEGEVVNLTPDTFTNHLSKGPMFVKFFAPWCGHCKKLAPVWKQLGRHMQNKLTIAQVNCDDHGGLCKLYGVQGYPMLLYLGTGGLRSEYNGSRKLHALKAFSEKASAEGLQAIKSSQLSELVAQNEVVYLLLHSATDKEIMDMVRRAAGPLLGSPVIFTSSDPNLLSQFSIPQTSTWALVAFKDHDIQTPSSIIHERISSEKKLTTWLLSHRLSTIVELNQDTFQQVMNAPQEPLVVIAAVTKEVTDKVKERFKEIGKKWRIRTSGSGTTHGRDIVFSWMDSERWSDWMKSMYGISKDASHDETLDEVHVIIADHKRLIYYDNDLSESRIKITSTATLFPAIEAAAAGKLRFKHSENFVERMARYLNTKMTAAETYIITYPFRTVVLVLLVIALIIWGLKKLVADDIPADRDPRAKADRID
ncbi:protein disulfide isomerase [Collybia nuda]|uniref:Protein disulfide isomerase n=1 Tax=Collybia nuda TaxID=64659 RepID=A0A9P6CQL2_9AGAR|nr:protein disulfide isomerase [Collybia nuda]